MYCVRCGSALPENSGFCPGCGQKKKKIAIGTIFSLSVAILLAFTLAYVLLVLETDVETGSESVQSLAGVELKEITYETPEKVFKAFIEGVKECDLQKMSESFGVQKVSSHFDFKAITKRLMYISPSSSMLPLDYQKFKEFNEIMAMKTVLHSYQSILFGINAIDMEGGIYITEDSQIEDYIKKTNPKSLKNLTIESFTDVEFASDERHLKNMKSSAEWYGADDQKMFDVLLECDGHKVYSQIFILKYDNSWYIKNAYFQPE